MKSEGRKFGKCEFSLKMWVGPQISEEKICIFGKKLVGPENAEEKICDLWKKMVGGYQTSTGTNFQHMFRKFLPDPPLVSPHFFHQINLFDEVLH